MFAALKQKSTTIMTYLVARPVQVRQYPKPAQAKPPFRTPWYQIRSNHEHAQNPTHKRKKKKFKHAAAIAAEVCVVQKIYVCYNVPLGLANGILFFNIGLEVGPAIEARGSTVVSTIGESTIADTSKTP